MSKGTSKPVLALLLVVTVLTAINTYLIIGDRVAAAIAAREKTAKEAEARETAQRLRSAARLRGIAQALYMYASDNGGKLPPPGEGWIDYLYKAQYIDQGMFTPAIGKGGPMPYRYVPPVSGTLDTSNPDGVLIAHEDPAMWGGIGANVAYADTQVKWLDREEFARLLADVGSK